MGGKPCIRGMRVTVGTVVGLIAAGRSQEEILHAYPYLELDDIHAALAYVAYKKVEDAKRLEALSELTQQAQELGLGY